MRRNMGRVVALPGQAGRFVGNKATSAMEKSLSRLRAVSSRAHGSISDTATKLKSFLNQKTICTCVQASGLLAPSYPPLVVAKVACAGKSIYDLAFSSEKDRSRSRKRRKATR